MGKEEEMYRISIPEWRKGKPCIGVGGGAFANTFQGRFVLREGKLAPTIFIRQRGSLSNELDQAVVPVRVGDLIVNISGSFPIDFSNFGLSIKTGKIADFVKDEVVLEEVDYPLPALPEKVVKGLSLYFNRDGRYFVA